MLPTTYRLALFLLLLVSAGGAGSAALRAQKPTDDSVCDLGPNTMEALARRALVPARQPLTVQVTAYTRIAAVFIVRNCSQGQVLIVDSKDGDQLDSRVLPDLAGSLCSASEIERRQMPGRSELTGEELRGFELRCRITKFSAYKADFEDKEKLETTEAYLSKLH
jgi:hypothetical protein